MVRAALLMSVRAAVVCGVLLGGMVGCPALSWGQASSPPRAGAPAWLDGWPLVGHDPQQTNRGRSIGPLHLHLLYAVPGMAGPVVVGPDGSVYGWGRGGLRAFDLRGRSRWITPIDAIEGGPPALAPDGLLVVNGMVVSGSGSTQLAGMAVLGLAATGRVRWSLHTLPWATAVNGTFSIGGKPLAMGPSMPLSKGVAPLISPAGQIYMPFIGPGPQSAGLEQITSGGVPVRRLEPELPPLAFALGPAGTVYEAGGEGGPLRLVALDAHGTERWTRPLIGEESVVGVLVGRGGRIYASAVAVGQAGTPGAVAAYTPSGRLLWRLGGLGGARLAERADGTLLVADALGLSAVDQNGTRQWRRTLRTPTAGSGAMPSLVVDAAGRAYMGTADGLVRAVGPDGRVLWTLRAGSAGDVSPSCALGPDGRLLVVGTDNLLRVFR